MANLQSINAVALRIIADRTQFDAALKGMNKQINGLGGIAKTAGVALAGMFAVDSIIGAVNGAIEFGKEIDAINTKVGNLTGLSGKALAGVTGEVKAVSDVFSKDYNEVLQTANVLSKQMGLSVDDSLKLIKQGLAGGADINGDFLEQVKEYAPQFERAGYTAGEMVSLMAQAGKEGIFNDKAADAVKEATLSLSEMTPAAQDALKAIGLSGSEIQSQLKDGSLTMDQAIKMVAENMQGFATNSSEYATAVADIFKGAGEDAGPQFIEMLATAELSMENLNEQTSEYGKAQLRLSDAQAELNSIWAEMFNGQNAFWTNIKATVTEFAVKALKTVVNGVRDIYNWFARLYNQSILVRGTLQAIILGFKNMWTVVKTVFKLIVDRVTNVGKILAYVLTPSNWGSGFGDGLKELFVEGFNDAKETVVEGAMEIGSNISTAVDNTINDQMKIWPEDNSKAEEAATQTGKDLGDNVIDGMKEKVKQRAPELLMVMGDELNDFDLYQIGLDIDRQVHDQMVNAGLAVAEGSDKMVGGFDDFVQQSGVIQNGIQGIGNAMTSAMEGTEGAFSGLVSSVLDSLGSFVLGQLAGALAATIFGATTTVPFPPAALAVAGAGILAVKALFNQQIPKFAKGGIVTGPTYGLVGEAGPEAIIPLSKMDNVLGGSGKVEFIQHGSQLRGVLDRQRKKMVVL